MKTIRNTAASGGKPKSAAEPEKRERLERVRNLIETVEANVAAGKSSVGDFIRLLQLEKELEAEEPPREIRVTWIDQTETRDFEE